MRFLLAILACVLLAGCASSSGESLVALKLKPPRPRDPIVFGTSGAPTVNEVLVTTNGTWTNNPTSFAYQWQRCSPSCSNITGATTASYTVQTADVGSTLDVTVTASNAGGSASQTSAQTGTVTTASTQPVGGPQGINWNLTFDDEFNGTSIDTSKWVIYNNPAVGCPGTAATCHPVHDNNGVTSSTALCSEGPFGPNGEGVLDLDTNGTQGCNIASAWKTYTPSLTASGANAWELPVGGYVEARVWFAASSVNPSFPVANWPTFWTAGANWPQNGEYDIAEGTRKLSCTYHTNGGSGTTDHVVGPVCVPGIGPSPTGSPDGWAGAWHTYGVYRGVNGAVFYWDGKDVNCMSNSMGQTIAPACADPLPITDEGGPQALRFTLGQDTNTPNISGPAGDMLVDWVRGYTPAG